MWRDSISEAELAPDPQRCPQYHVLCNYMFLYMWSQLIWGGSRYLANALCSLFHQDFRLIRRPVETINQFQQVFKMVLGCHRERSFLIEKQPHLVSWIPIAVPFTKWFLWPPPFQGNPFGSFGPLGIFPLFFKFYDSLCGFRCPPSHIMTKARTYRYIHLDLHGVMPSSLFVHAVQEIPPDVS